MFRQRKNINSRYKLLQTTGLFRYNIQTYQTTLKQITVFQATAEKPIQMQFLEFYFALSEDFSSITQTTLSDRFKFVANLQFNNMHWTTLWQGDSKFDLIVDNNAESVLSLPKFGTKYIHIERKINFETMELFIESRSKFWSTYFKVG